MRVEVVRLVSGEIKEQVEMGDSGDGEMYESVVFELMMKVKLRL